MLKKSIKMSKGKCKLFLFCVVFASSLGVAIFSFTNSYGENVLCEVDDKTRLGDGFCDLEGNYNTKFCRYDSSCDFDYGFKYCRNDCLDHNRKQDMIKKYPECECPNCEEEDEDIYDYMGDGNCDKYSSIFESLNTTECGWDGGDCVELNRRKKEMMIKYPNCFTDDRDYEILGDGYCYDYSYINNEECGWDGGDCDELNRRKKEMMSKYPNCKHPSALTTEDNEWVYEYLGDGSCRGTWNNEECGWDGGDCAEFNQKKNQYPDCVYLDEWNYKDLGNGYCESYRNFNNEECGWDDGDCL